MHSPIQRDRDANAIEVTVVFEDDVVQVRQLPSPRRTRRDRRRRWGAAVACGMGVILLGFVALLTGQFGGGGLLVLTGLPLVVYGRARWRESAGPTEYTVGDLPEVDLPIRTSGPSSGPFSLVSLAGAGYRLNIPPGLSGELYFGPGRLQLSNLAGASMPGLALVHGPGGVCSLTLGGGTSARIVVDRYVVWVRAVEDSARSFRSALLSRLDWSAQVHNALSLAGHALIIGLVFAIPPTPKTLSLQLFGRNEQLSRYLVRPVTAPPMVAPRASKAGGGGGAKVAAGASGSMGGREATRSRKRFALREVPGVSPQLAREFARQSARRAGILGLLGHQSGGILTSIIGGEHAFGDETEQVLGNLIGDQIGEAPGVGGLGLTGGGRYGGCGDDCGDQVGSGSLRGISGPGRGLGPEVGLAAPLSRDPERDPRGPTIVSLPFEPRGQLDKSIIRRVVRRHLNEVRYCYQKELQSHPNLTGRVVIDFTISADGRVLRAAVDQLSTLGNAEVEHCIAKAIRRWAFPKPKDGGLVHVRYPFVLRAPGQSQGA